MDNVNLDTGKIEVDTNRIYRDALDRNIKYAKALNGIVLNMIKDNGLAPDVELRMCKMYLRMYVSHYSLMYDLIYNKITTRDIIDTYEGKIENILCYLSNIINTLYGGTDNLGVTENTIIGDVSNIEGKLDAGLEHIVGNAIENTVQSKIMPNLETITEMLLDLQNTTPCGNTGDVGEIVNEVINSKLSLNGDTLAEQVEKYAAFTANTENVKSGKFTPALKLTKQGIREKRAFLGKESGKGLSVGNVGVAEALNATAAGVDNFIDKCILERYSETGDVNAVVKTITEELYMSSEEVIRRLKKMTDKIAELKARDTGSKEIAKKLNVSRRLIDKILLS